ncbi:MAG: UDP binding domain-containing protein [Candidatus Villigracilaceae bacterium]
MAYKPDVDDLRESPAVETVHLLQEAGAKVRCFEPFKPHAVLPGLTLAPTLEAALAGSEALLLLVGHTQFRGLDPAWVAAQTPSRLAIDTVNGWQARVWKEAGFTLLRLGDGK